MKRIYIAGPMRSIKNFNFPAFHAASQKLRADGHIVFNPAEQDEQDYGVGFASSKTGNLADIPAFDLRKALAKDLEFIVTKATAIALLPGWENSKGANAELAAARAIGLEEINL